MPRTTSNVVWTVLLAVLALLGFAAAALGPRLYREGRAVVAPVAELAASEKAMAALEREFPFHPPEDGLVAEERLTVFFDVWDDLRAQYAEWQDLVTRLGDQRTQSWRQAKEVLAATRDVHVAQRETLRRHGMSPAELVWLDNAVLSWWRKAEPRLADADRPAVTEALRRAREDDLQVVATLVRRHGPSPALEEMEDHLERSLGSLGSSAVPEVEGVALENQRLFWRHRTRIAPIEGATQNPLHQMVREQGRRGLSANEAGPAEVSRGPEASHRD